MRSLLLESRLLYKSVLISLSIILCLTMVVQPTTAEEIGVSAQAAILIDGETGRVLYEKNSHEKLRIASITKIMTAIIAIENGNLDDMVTTSENAFGTEGSSIYLKQGEKLSLEHMLYGLMLRSGNDAAVAIAEHVGGSVEGFSFLMNQKAEELGMRNTIFNNPHGLDTHEEHYSTAYDMAILTAYAMKNDTFAEISKTQKKSAPLEGEKWDRLWYNKNRLLKKYPHADGVKTGYTKRAKRTLVSSATKDGHRLIAVTLNAPDDWNDHIKMFEYGFNKYSKKELVTAGEKLVGEDINRNDGYFQYKNSFYYPLLESEKVQARIVLDAAFSKDELEAIPQPAGHIIFELNEKEIGRTAIQFIPFETDERPSLWQRFQSIFDLLLGGYYG